MERLTIDGGEVWLGFARNRVKAFKKAGIRYTRQVFDMPDGAKVIVEMAGKDHAIRLSKTETEWVRAAMPNVRVPEIVEPNEEEYKELAPAQVRRGWIESADSAVDYDDVTNSVFGVNAYNSAFLKRTRTRWKHKPGIQYNSTTMFPGVYSDTIYEFDIITNDTKKTVRWETSGRIQTRSEAPLIPTDWSLDGWVQVEYGLPWNSSDSVKNTRAYNACFNINISKRSVIAEVVYDGESGEVSNGTYAAFNEFHDWKLLWVHSSNTRAGFVGKSRIIFRFAAPPTKEGEESKYFEIESSAFDFFVGKRSSTSDLEYRGGPAKNLAEYIERVNSPLCDFVEENLPKNRSVTTDEEIFLLRETSSYKTGFKTSRYRYVHHGFEWRYSGRWNADGSPQRIKARTFRWDYIFEPEPLVTQNGYAIEVINIEKPTERFTVKSPQALGNNGFIMAIIITKQGNDQNVYAAYTYNNDPNKEDHRGNRELPETFTYKLDRYRRTEGGLTLAETIVVGNFNIPGSWDGRYILREIPNFLGAFFATKRFIWTDCCLYDLKENRLLPLPYECGYGYNTSELESHRHFTFSPPTNYYATIGPERWAPFGYEYRKFWRKHYGDNPWETQSNYIFISPTGREAKYIHCMTGQIVSYRVVLGEEGELQEIKIEKIEDFGPGTGAISDDRDSTTDALYIDFRKGKSKR